MTGGLSVLSDYVFFFYASAETKEKRMIQSLYCSNKT